MQGDCTSAWSVNACLRRSLSSPNPLVERNPQPVAEQVEGEHRDCCDERPRRDQFERCRQQCSSPHSRTEHRFVVTHTLRRCRGFGTEDRCGRPAQRRVCPDETETGDDQNSRPLTRPHPWASNCTTAFSYDVASVVRLSRLPAESAAAPTASTVNGDGRQSQCLLDPSTISQRPLLLRFSVSQLVALHTRTLIRITEFLANLRLYISEGSRRTKLFNER